MPAFVHDVITIFVRLVQQYGYVGIFLIAVTVCIYQPIAPDIFIIGEVGIGLNPYYVALFALLGSFIGAFLGYFIGRFLDNLGVKRIRKNKYVKKFERLFRKYGNWAVFLGALTPVPLREMSWLSGIFRLSLLQFMLFVFLGLFPRYFLEAIFGKYFLQWIQKI
ncbi:SNARE associated Golgi protein [bacterium BMS3Abin05]|nr:SNARE associated Golgi protein [bacterium BMS3Abin05]GBE27500.1 SNARE associated Golgi protein [bacterium BMS3Bbin03]HDK35628.1 DedA family protein [Bacteroidota bacterium]HDZ11340.1 DedA family protein [Bacteroidota bacterium]